MSCSSVPVRHSWEPARARGPPRWVGILRAGSGALKGYLGAGLTCVGPVCLHLCSCGCICNTAACPEEREGGRGEEGRDDPWVRTLKSGRSFCCGPVVGETDTAAQP